MNTTVARHDPRRADRLNAQAGLDLQRAGGTATRIARSAGVSAELARRWCRGSSGNPFARAYQVVAALGADVDADPYPLVAGIKIIAIQTQVLRMTDEQLVHRFHEVLTKATAAEADQLMRKVNLARSRDLAGLRDASAIEATLDEQLAAICAELQQRGIDPWTWE